MQAGNYIRNIKKKDSQRTSQHETKYMKTYKANSTNTNKKRGGDSGGPEG